jgi:hypothetical protein
MALGVRATGFDMGLDVHDGFLKLMIEVSVNQSSMSAVFFKERRARSINGPWGSGGRL